MGYNPYGEAINSLAGGRLKVDVSDASASTASRKCIAFKSDDEFIHFVQRVIFKNKSIKRQKLLVLIYNYGKKLEDLNSISFLGPFSTTNNNGDEVKGEIAQSGDGVKGYNGNGPITYHFKETGSEGS